MNPHNLRLALSEWVSEPRIDYEPNDDPITAKWPVRVKTDVDGHTFTACGRDEDHAGERLLIKIERDHLRRACALV